MSKEKPCRWGVTVLCGDGRKRTVSPTGFPQWWWTRKGALISAGNCNEEQHARIVRLIPKKKPRVVRRKTWSWVHGTSIRRIVEELEQQAKAWLTSDKITHRITLEEMADD